MDTRTEEYINKYKENIGLICGMYSSEHNVQFSEIYDTFEQDGVRLNGFKSPTITIGKDNEDNYVVSKVYFDSLIEDIVYIEYYFKEKPTRKLFYQAELIAKFKSFCLGINLTNNCWECGSTFHILDIDGNIEDKISHFENSFCRCDVG